MGMNLTQPKPGETVWLWLLKIISGLLVFVLLAVHFIVNHYLAPNGLLGFQEVVEYYQNPLVPIMEGVFLVLLISHSLIGMRGIFLDMNLKRNAYRVLDIILWMLGIMASVYGIWLLFAVMAHG